MDRQKRTLPCSSQVFVKAKGPKPGARNSALFPIRMATIKLLESLPLLPRICTSRKLESRAKGGAEN